MPDATNTEIEHAKFCTPRPGSKEPRVESFLAERSGDDGEVLSRPRVTRCIECGEQVVEG